LPTFLLAEEAPGEETDGVEPETQQRAAVQPGPRGVHALFRPAGLLSSRRSQRGPEEAGSPRQVEATPGQEVCQEATAGEAGEAPQNIPMAIFFTSVLHFLFVL